MLFKKFVGRTYSKSATPTSAGVVEEQLESIHNGDKQALNRFIAAYQPFVAKVASRFAKRYIDPAKDDEYSIALQAFHEAIMNYSQRGGTSFFNFAETVIRRRLIDYVRKEKKHQAQIPYSSFEIVDDEDHAVNPVEIGQAMDQYALELEAKERKSEIIELNHALSPFGITFMDLAECSPKHADSRKMLMDIGKMLGEDAELMKSLISKNMLPIKELLELVQVSRKTLERNRKYIIAIALIHSGSYPHLQEYVTTKKTSISASKEVGLDA